MKKLGENRKKWLFSKASLCSVTKIPGPALVPDPSFIRIRYFLQTPTVICNPAFIREIRVQNYALLYEDRNFI